MPLVSVVVVPVPAPLKVMVTPAKGLLPPPPPNPPLVVTLPEIEYVVALGVPVKFWPVTFAPLMVTVLLVGLNVYPVLLGVTVYVPLARPVKV